ncbi:MAG TPA: HAD family hydrolase [Pirellulaceae bacterium]|nr:HAD family hydrolase [Pirellulaceae bacterium]
MARQLLILDLDETLFYAALSPRGRPPDFELAGYSVYRRPFLQEFLDFAFENFAVAVWSSATEPYVRAAAREVIARSADLQFIWSMERCTRRFNGETREEYWVKDLKKLKRLGFSLDRVLVMDDSPEKHERNYGNLVPVRPFFGDQADTELRDITPFLDRLQRCEDVRKIEKRNWRNWL